MEKKKKIAVCHEIQVDYSTQKLIGIEIKKLSEYALVNVKTACSKLDCVVASVRAQLHTTIE